MPCLPFYGKVTDMMNSTESEEKSLKSLRAQLKKLNKARVFYRNKLAANRKNRSLVRAKIYYITRKLEAPKPKTKVTLNPPILGVTPPAKHTELSRRRLERLRQVELDLQTAHGRWRQAALKRQRDHLYKQIWPALPIPPLKPFQVAPEASEAPVEPVVEIPPAVELPQPAAATPPASPTHKPAWWAEFKAAQEAAKAAASTHEPPQIVDKG